MYGCVTIYVKIKRNKKNILPLGLPVRKDQSPREAVLILRTVFIGRAHWPSIQHLQNATQKKQGHLVPGWRDGHTPPLKK